MTIKEIEELLTLTGWSKTDLAYHLDMSESAIWKWFREMDEVRGAAGTQMRDWLERARHGIPLSTSAFFVWLEQQKTNGHKKPRGKEMAKA